MAKQYLYCAFPILLVACNRPTSVEEIIPPANQTVSAKAISVSYDDWPWWWGPSSDGTSVSEFVPTQWNATDNVIWKVPVDGRGHSSPCIRGGQIFLTTADDKNEKQLIICLNRVSGESMWKTIVHEGGFMRSHSKNSHASATPASDGDRVFVAFINDGALQITAVDHDGNLVWQEEAGKFGAEHGYGSSPVLHGSLVIVLGDNMTGSFIAALDRETGQIVWRTARETTGRHGSYATPIVAKVAGRTQLLVTGMSGVSSYDPMTGELLWFCDGPAEVTACTIAASDELVFASGGYPEKELLAIRADGSGDVTHSHIVWRTKKGVTYVPSPLYHDGLLFVFNDNGIATCYRADTGEQLGRRRLDGNFSASPIFSAGMLFIPNEAGNTYVLKADALLESISENDLSDGGFASPSICGGHIFLRTLHNLYCIGECSPLAKAN